MRSMWSRLWISRPQTIRKQRGPKKSQLRLERLEGRLMLSTTVSLDAAGNLVIVDTDGGTSNDNITIKSDTTNSQFVISDPVNTFATDIAGASGSGTNSVLVPFGSVSGSEIVVNTLGGDDFLTVDLGLGNFAKSITYDGGSNGSAGDELILQGGATFAAVTHTFVSASAGSVAISGNALITYSGLEPVSDNLSATDRAFTFTGGPETITLFPPVGSSFDLAIDSSLGEFVAFTNPTNSLTIDAGTGDDTVNINGVRPTFAASLIINGGVGHDTVNLNNDITFAANRNLDVDLQNDDAANPGTDRIAAAANANFVLSGTGTATLKASSSISFAPGSSLITADGVLLLEANGPGTGDANFTGILVNGATVQSTGSGAVQILGRGGIGGTNNHGVRLTGAAVIQSGTGPLQVLGTGGISSGSPNPGVSVEGLGAIITSAGGNVQVTGIGGGTGVSFGNTGVIIRSGQITAGGAGTVKVHGTGGTTSGGPNRGVEMFGGSITSSGGDVQVTGVGGAVLGTNGTNFGVFVGATGQISAGGTGTVNVHGTGSLAGGINNHGVLVTGDISRITSGGGNIQVTGIQGAGSGSFAIALTANGSVASVGAANVDLIGDSMLFDATAVVAGGANTVTLRQRTNGTAITLNAADAAGVLGLTDTELDRVTAATIDIGDSNAGTITVTSTISRGAPTLMNLTTGSNIALNGLLVDQFAVVNLNAPSGSITTPPGGSSAAPDVRAATVNVDGVVAPGGASAGELAVDGSLVFSSTDRYRAQLNGATAFSQYDVVSVTGTANLGAATLEVLPSFTPSIGQLFTIVNTSGGVAGTFRDTSGNPLNEGATFVANGITFSITYQGGSDGRDVVLRAQTTGITISISDASVVETNAGTTTITFNVTLSAPGNQTIAVNYATADGTATTADGDYIGASGTVGFGIGETSKPVSITVNGDLKFELNETFVVNLSNAVGATIGDSQGVGTIVNDDTRPTISIDDLSMPEGNSGPTSFVFTVSLSNPSFQAITVNFATADGTATTGDNDYQGGVGTVTFAPGVISQTVTVLINGDTKFEPDETFAVNLSAATNATIADGSGLGTIRNDDAEDECDGTIELIGGVLTIHGTDEDDHVHVNRVGSGNKAQIRVHASFLEGKSHVSFDESSITRIVIILCDGDDQATVAGNVTLDVSMDGEAGDDYLQAGGGDTLLRGGDGNDELEGGSENDILVGGDGHDQLVSGGGRDLLIGGAGSDLLVGCDGDDILIAAFTDHDAHDAALLDIMKEWTSSHTFQQRINNLKNGTGGGDGGPRNGTTFLNALTVHDDAAIDLLRGGGGTDWLLYNFSGNGVKDIATDVSGSETEARFDL